MPQSNNILQELRDLQSNLAAGVPGNIYSAAPAGYFDGLIEQVIKRIKALEADSAKEELNHLSPLLNSLSREMPYEVPQGFFESIDTNIHTTPEEELESISPFLGGLKKQMPVRPDGLPGGPYEVPQGYFEKLGTKVIAEDKPAKVVRMTSHKWIRYAAAAVITGVLAIGAWFVWNRNNDVEAMPIVRFEKKLNKEIKNMSDTELNEFLKSTNPAMVGDENASVNGNDEIKDLLKDVSDTELREFLEETSDSDIETSMMN